MTRPEPALSEAQTAEALRRWSEYQKVHDLTDLQGMTAGIDPDSGRIWLGESIRDVVRQMRADGLDAPLQFMRVGSDYYFRKGIRG